MFWFNKTHKDTVFADVRNCSLAIKDSGCASGVRHIIISPDVQADFVHLPFTDETFSMVVIDPPHLLHGGKNSWMVKKYGKLPMQWKHIIHDGFVECMRVLKKNSILVFKWSANDISTKAVLDVIPFNPLFGHPTKRHGHTIWMVFMK